MIVRFVSLAFLASLPGLSAAESALERPLTFNRDIRPILSENCFQCHGPDKNSRKAKLRLDIRDEAILAGAFEPGDPDLSDAIVRVFSKDPDEVMPPLDSHRSLTAAQKDTLKRWVTQGAAYEPHWAFVAPVRPPVPTLAPGGTAANPIDAFVAAELAKAGLSSSPETDRRTLIRRLSLDLTGLPPSSADVEAFVANRDPRAYEKLVDDTLASRHYGERMAIPWLDLVRYADTVGFHGDVAIRVWPYRDYVIDAFNRNLPFDQFTREQLAGDLLPGSTMTQRVASGYNRLHRISGEGGIQDKEYFAKYAGDRVRTTATAFMGTTLACAECHDHKFDPFTIEDFYRFAAIFSDLKEKGAYNLSGGFTPENLTEEMIFSSDRQRVRVGELDAEIVRLKKQAEAIADDRLAEGRLAWEARILALLDAGQLAWTTATPQTAESPEGTPLTIEEDRSISPGGHNPENDTYRVTIPAEGTIVGAVKLETILDPRYPGDGLARSGQAFYLSEIEIAGSSKPGAELVPLAIAAVRIGSTAENGYPPAAAIDRDENTALSFVRKNGGAVALDLAQPFEGGPGKTLTVTVKHSKRHPYQNLGRFRLSVHALSGIDPARGGMPTDTLKALRIPLAERETPQSKELSAYYRGLAPELAEIRAQLDAASVARGYLALNIPTMPVSRSVERRTMRVLPRGNWMDDSGEVVEPGVPQFMRQIETAPGTPMTRLDFANWLVAPDNPLTARTFVNRVWRIFYGAGLSRTLEDLGSQGEWPTHPELLDWLAVEFRESGWDVKHLVKLMVTSNAYRQSSRSSALLEERDPLNRLLARQSRFRFEAELVRDNALAISGLLVPTIGGPSAKPYQPTGYYAALNFPSREYVQDRGEGLYRRGVYTHWQRTFLHPSLMAFDAPARDECTANRAGSNTPLQALVLLNDPTYVEAARVFAEKIMRDGGADTDAKISWAFARTLARPPTDQERRLLTGLLEKQRARYRGDERAAKELISTGDAPLAQGLPHADLAAWTSVGRTLLNLHETITRN